MRPRTPIVSLDMLEVGSHAIDAGFVGANSAVALKATFYCFRIQAER
jgi:hypothetical protein